jgi:hypothetical protein
MISRFQPGDHLKVRRPLFYDHHGVYISDDRVIQFGAGIWDKPRAKIDAVKLRDFEKRGTARVVRHGRDSPFTGYHPAADAPWKRIARAEFLYRLQPKLRYNVIGYNCEHIANMCVIGNWPESYQVRRIFGAHAYATMGVMFWLGRRSRAQSPFSGPYRGYFLLSSFVALGAVGMYNRQIRKFWKEIGPQWQAHERALADDPRNGLPE